MIICTALLVTSCGTGATTGASLGSVLGSAIGGLVGGPRGSDVGTIVGMAGGAAVGAAVDNAAEKRKQEELAARNQRIQRSKEAKAQAVAHNQARQQTDSPNDDLYFTPSQTGNAIPSNTTPNSAVLDTTDSDNNPTVSYDTDMPDQIVSPDNSGNDVIEME